MSLIRMNRYVTDTQALVRFLSGSKGISKAADLIFSRADAGEDTIIVPAVVLFEIAYLHERGRIAVSVKDLRAVLEDSLNYREEKLCGDHRSRLCHHRHPGTARPADCRHSPASASAAPHQ